MNKEEASKPEPLLSAEHFRKSISIENVSPELDCGRFPVKRIVGDTVEVSADILKLGQDTLRGSLLHRKKGKSEWTSAQMKYDYNDESWMASFLADEIGVYEYKIQAWTDEFQTLISKIQKWLDSGEDVSGDLYDLNILVESAISSSQAPVKRHLLAHFKRIQDAEDAGEKLKLCGESEFAELMNDCLAKPGLESSRTLEVVVDPSLARYAAWYEMFPRSQGTFKGRSATFKDCENRLDEIRKMGFDVIYLPPIHPIGHTNRRGRNNTQDLKPGDPGSPWAIGNKDGGHMSIHRDLGTMDDFVHFVETARKLGMHVALDLAYQCSPDHPYLKQHPEWFYRRSDGKIRFAENPPKRYYDIVPFFFGNENWKGLWEELLNIVNFWIRRGVKIFRVDNPHTKPYGFWEWLISNVKSSYPEVIFLAEAFTRPKEMKLLAKLGFSQSYTYFTWKNTKKELQEFLKEFVLSETKEYYRGNFFANTPDILSEYLQNGGRPAFKIRLVLAATLSSSFGVYNGFELCENHPLSPGSEEYLDSEKYQYKVWDWDRAGNIKDFIGRVNRIRRENPALHFTQNLRLFEASNEHVIFYGKWTVDKTNVIFVAVNLDPHNAHESNVSFPAEEFGLGRSYKVRDLITGNRFEWKGDSNYVRLDPDVEPAHVLLLEK